MTLVLTALTPRHIVQVSDRRVVFRYRSGIEKPRDKHVKAVVTQRFACSYTGIADLAGDTADWLAVHLSDQTGESDGGISTIGEAAEKQLAAQSVAGQELTIVCVGWTQHLDRFKPTAAIVSNRGNGIETSFHSSQITIAERRPSAVFPVGQELVVGELVNVNRVVRRLCSTGRDTARAIAQVLTEAVRTVAASPGRSKYVSEDVLVTSLPRPDLLRGNFGVGQLVEDYSSVTNIPAGELRVERHGGPIIVGRKAAIQALPPEDGPPGGGLFVGARIVRKPDEEGSISLLLLTDPPLGPAWAWPA